MNGISTASGDMVPYAFLATLPFFPQEQSESFRRHTSARRRRSQRSLHYAPLGFGAIQRVERVSLPLVPRAFCPQPRQTIRILRQQRKLPLIQSRMCSSNQYPAHPVKKNVFRAPLVRLLHLRTGLYV